VVDRATYRIQFCQPVGHGEHMAYVILQSPDMRARRIVVLSSVAPCAVGLQFEANGERWAVTGELDGKLEGMWAALPVEQ
jgi:hypothetical protein